MGSRCRVLARGQVGTSQDIPSEMHLRRVDRSIVGEGARVSRRDANLGAGDPGYIRNSGEEDIKETPWDCISRNEIKSLQTYIFGCE